MKMKKTMLAVFLTLACAISAHAFSVPAGDWNAHFSDYSSIYGDPNNTGTYTSQSAGYVPVTGDFLKGVYNLEQVIPKGGGLSVWSPSITEQIAGFEYNLGFLGLTGVVGSGSEKTYWGPTAAGTSSHLELYQRDPFVYNTGASFAPQTGPSALGTTLGHPGVVAGINDGGASLFLDLQALLHPDQAFQGATLVLTGNITTGTGSGDGYFDAVGGSYMNMLESKPLGPAGISSDMYVKFSYNTNAPLNGWTVKSEDPVEFTVVPEPSTIVLLGVGLLGVGVFGRRKKE